MGNDSIPTEGTDCPTSDLKIQIDVSKSSLLYNIKYFQSITNHVAPIIPVVKANAYGHGVKEVLLAVGEIVDGIQVDDLQELVEARKFWQKRILVLGYLHPAEIALSAALDCEIGIISLEQLKFLASSRWQNAPIKIHLAFDLGFGREGILLSQVADTIDILKRAPHLLPIGAYCHLSHADAPAGDPHTERQFTWFDEVITALYQGGFNSIRTHIDASACALRTLNKKLDASHHIRLGLGLYGMMPIELEALDTLKDNVQSGELQPALTWRTILAAIKEVPAGYSIGYGQTFITATPTRLGLLPLGYSDGLDRRLSQIGEVLVCGVRCPIRGRISMNMTTIEIPAQITTPLIPGETPVVILGKQGDQRITAEEMAKKIGTINYEITARLPRGIQRNLVE